MTTRSARIVEIGAILSGAWCKLTPAPAAAHDRRSIWLVPAVAVAGVLVLFALAFRERGVAAETVKVERDGALA